MRGLYISEAVKILLMVAAVLIVCVLCAVGFKMTNDGKSATTAAANQFTDMTNQYSDVELKLFEGSTVPGSEVRSLIKKMVDNDYFVSIEVVTLDGSSRSYNYIYEHNDFSMNKEGADTEAPSERSEYAYINDMANFNCTTYRGVNGDIVCLRFEQE
ncbi:MAG: hypothetical protein QM644_14965 [Mobilitalea sp.]